MTIEEKIAELINIRDNFNYTLAPREVLLANYSLRDILHALVESE